MSGQRFSGYTAILGYATGQTLNLNQLTHVGFEANLTQEPVIPMGALTPVKHLTTKAEPAMIIRTGDLASVFAAISGLNGLLCDETSTFQWQERSDDGVGFLTTNTHSRFTCAKGIVVPDTLTADLNSGMAELTLRFIGLGTSDPFTKTDAVALTGTAPGYGSGFFLASPYLNGTEIPGVQSISINFGIELQPGPSKPSTFNDLVSKIRQNPELSFTVLKADEQWTLATIGNSIATSFAIYLQKADPDTDRIAPGTGSHFKCSCTAGKFSRDSISVDGNDDAAVQFMVKPQGSIAISTSSTIGG